MKTPRQREIFQLILENGQISISGILEKLKGSVSIPTLNRELAFLRKSNFILPEGKGPATKYKVNTKGLIKAEIDPDRYFKTEMDERKIINHFNPEIFNDLKSTSLLTKNETIALQKLTTVHQKKISQMSPGNYKREFERLMIELSWKSAQIEGNTYDLLDTEQLLKYNIPSPNHTEEEAIMLLNHKTAIEYTRENADLFLSLSLNNIIDIHTLLTSKLNISKEMRTRLVRITGTQYVPPENPFVIEEALRNLCSTVNTMDNVYEKALVALLGISYIQPFDDGNKRTARLTANALLMAHQCSPLSYRSMSPSEFKKSILLFYELNNVQSFKKIFVSQYQFAVENYF
jgi:Fic/DOC family